MIPTAAIQSLVGIAVHSPSGAAWEFLALFLVVIVGPPLLERARLPGIIGLLLGGYVIGPHGLNLIGAGNTTVPSSDSWACCTSCSWRAWSSIFAWSPSIAEQL